MADLIFATKGQAEALAAQEQIAKKGRELRQEFESGAKSVGAWDANTAKLARTSEAALRSIQTEQEKVAEKIALINEAQAKGIGTTEENEAAIAKLRQQWVDLDEATVKQREAVAAVAEEHTRLKTSAETALRSVATEEERVADELEAIEQQVRDVQAAAAEGLIPTDEAEQGVSRLRDRLDELKQKLTDTHGLGEQLGVVFNKAFDVKKLAPFVTRFLGVGAAIGILRKELSQLQDTVDKVGARQETAYADAVKRGDVETAARLRPRAEGVAALERGAQRFAERASTKYASEKELADFWEIMSQLHPGLGGYSYQLGVGSRLRALGGGKIRREDLRKELEREELYRDIVPSVGGLFQNQSAEDTKGQWRDLVHIIEDLKETSRPHQDQYAAEQSAALKSIQQSSERTATAVEKFEPGILVGTNE